MYLTLEKYKDLYGEIDPIVFNRACYDACKYIDRHTTGIDGVRKLKDYFPVSESSVEAVERCTAEIVNIIAQIQEAEKSASAGRGYTKTENGLQGKVVSSVSAGNESVSYSATGNQASAIDAAVSDLAARAELIRATVRHYLSDETDRNGVSLLYMGVYPCV